MIREAGQIRQEDSPASALAKLGKVVGHLPDGSFIAEQVASIVGLSSRRPVPDELPWAVRKYLEAFGGDRSVIVVFEDIHWAERGLLDLIEYLGSTATRMLIICTARSDLLERHTRWGGGRNSLNLVIPSLDLQESRQLLASLLDGAPIADRAESLVLSAAEGNPLFIEELLTVLMEDGTLERIDGVWRETSPVTDVPVPPSVQALLTARLDRLSNAERLVLEHGALVGREFREHDLDGFPALAALDVPGVVARLVEKELLYLERESMQSNFSFRHVLMRDTAYQGMSKLNRAFAHEAYAALLEQRAGERLAEIEDLVGYHLESAETYRSETGLPVSDDSPLALRAARHLAAAGNRAFDREDMSTASGLLSRAAVLLDEEEAVRLGVTWRLGIALFELGELTEAERVLERGTGVADRIGATTSGWWLRMELAELRSWRDLSQYVEVMEIGRRAATELEASGDMAGVARAYRLMGHAYASRGELEKAIEHFETARVYAEKAEDERELSQTPNLGVVHSPVPAPRCLELIQSNLGRARRPDPDGLAGLGFVLTMLGRQDEAEAAFVEAHERAIELGSRWKAANVGMYYGGALLLIDDARGAESRLRPATEILQAMGERRMFSTAVALLAEALFRLSEHEQAMLATMLSEESTAADDFASQMLWMGVRAKILAVRGEFDEAEHLAEEALAVAHRTDFVNMMGDAHMDFAFVLRRQGAISRAQTSAREALHLYERKQNDPSQRRARRFLDELSPAMGKTGKTSPSRGLRMVQAPDKSGA
jgi:tetratricopeptide (TPR) repeat protein